MKPPGILSPGGFFIESKFSMKYLQTLILIVFLLSNIPLCHACDSLNAGIASFGTSDGSSEILNMRVADVQFKCDKKFRLGLNGGQNYSGDRRLTDGKGHFITYHLWQDSGSNTKWGSKGTPALAPHPADALSGKSSGSLDTFPVYGSVFSAGANPPGLYTDVIRVILIYPPFGSGVPLETDVLISLELVGNCTLNLAGLGDFGEWPAGSADLEGIPLGTVTVACNPPGMTYAIGMGAGMNLKGGIRHMRSGSNLVPYILYADGGRSQPWGDSGLSQIEPGCIETFPSPAITAAATGLFQNFFVWGDALISTSPSGTYTDTVSVTVVWP